MTRRRGIDPDLIHAYLRRIEHNHWVKSYFALVGGAMLALVGPLFITLSFLIFSLALIADHGFWVTYWIIAAVSLPIMFLIAYRVKGSILETAMPDGGDSFAGRMVQRQVAKVLIIAEIANFGPRLVLWGVAQLRGRSRMGQVDMNRLAEAIGVLSETDGGIGPVNLLQPSESADHLTPLLGLLLYYEIADMSKAGDRIWLTTTAKQQILTTRVRRSAHDMTPRPAVEPLGSMLTLKPKEPVDVCASTEPSDSAAEFVRPVDSSNTPPNADLRTFALLSQPDPDRP